MSVSNITYSGRKINVHRVEMGEKYTCFWRMAVTHTNKLDLFHFKYTINTICYNNKGSYGPISQLPSHSGLYWLSFVHYS